MCSLDLPTYPNLVREFYGTLARGSYGFVSIVRGKKINVTTNIIGEVLNISTKGDAPTIHSDREVTLKLILGRDDVNPIDNVSASQLSVEMRLLHNIIERILFPKVGRFDFIFERDLILMHSIIEGIPINLPQMIVSYICAVASKAHSSLPYRMLLTLIFRRFRVVILDEKPKKLLIHTDEYNARTLQRMGFHTKKWTVDQDRRTDK